MPPPLSVEREVHKLAFDSKGKLGRRLLHFLGLLVVFVDDLEPDVDVPR